ncbi:MAG: hypothetical protein ACD_54C01330G0001 [uncultured bacterium]|nr:MAG: hypothetical protein ACD_54C01330G0001 [uncultured bacterium]
MLMIGTSSFTLAGEIHSVATPCNALACAVR